MHPDSDETRSVCSVLALMQRTRKALRLYVDGDQISTRLEHELATAIGDHLDRWGPLEFTVLENEIRFRSAGVYRFEGRSDDIGFLLFRDGIRQLVILPGFGGDELHDLLTAINRVSVGVGSDEDLVTLLWELGLENLRYVAIETLCDRVGGDLAADQLASGRLEGKAPAGGVDLEELQRPAAHLPVGSCRLTELESEQLIHQIQEEDDEDLPRAIVELAVDLTLLSRETGACEKIAVSLAAHLARCLDTGVGELIRGIAILDDLAEDESFRSLAVENLRNRALEELARPRCVEAILDAADRSDFRPEALSFLLIRLGHPPVPIIVERLERVESAKLRRVVADVIQASGRTGVRLLMRRLETPSGTNPGLYRAIVPLIGTIAVEDGVALVERLLAVPDQKLRRKVVRQLGPYRDGAAGELWKSLLDDNDDAMRLQAVSAIVRSGRAALARDLVMRVLAPAFADRSAGEKRHVMVGIGRLAGDRSLPWFEQLIRTTDTGIFAPRRNKELIRVAIDGVRSIGTRASRSLLDEIGRSGDRFSRTVCRETSALVVEQTA